MADQKSVSKRRGRPPKYKSAGKVLNMVIFKCAGCPFCQFVMDREMVPHCFNIPVDQTSFELPDYDKGIDSRCRLPERSKDHGGKT